MGPRSPTVNNQSGRGPTNTSSIDDLLRKGEVLSALSDEQFHRQTLEQGGASRQVLTGYVPERGYMVGGANDLPEKTHSVEKFSVDDVRHHARAIRNSRRELDDLQNVHQGSWVHEGKVYLDAAEQVHTRKAAERLGRQRKQKAIYDLGKGEDIHLSK